MNKWELLERNGKYFIWKYVDEKDQTIYNVTTEKLPPTNGAGYYSCAYLLKVKGLMPGDTIQSILNEWAK